MSCPLATERVWTDKARYNEAEKNYFEQLSKLLKVDSDKIISDDVGEESYAYPLPAKAGKNNHKKKVANDKEATNVASNEVKEAPVAKHKKEKNKKNKQINNDSAVNKDGEEKIDQEKDVVVKIKEVKKEGSLEKTTDEIIKVDEVKPKKPKKKKKNNNKEETSPDNLKAESVKKQDSNNIKNPTKAANNEPVPQVEKPKPEKIKVHGGGQQCNTLVSEIAKARQHIKNSLERMDGIAALAATPGTDVVDKVNHLQKETDKLTKMMNQLQKYMAKMETRMNQLEEQVKNSSSVDTQTSSSAVTSKPKMEERKKNEAEDDDGVDLFASDSEEEDASAAKIREQRLAEYNAKKSKKPALIAKSNVILDVKPWDDETDLTKMEEVIRKIDCDGLLWGASKFVPVAFGIKKLSISCVVEDEKVSIDWLTEEIEKHEDFVQSVDVAAFNKI